MPRLISLHLLVVPLLGGVLAMVLSWHRSMTDLDVYRFGSKVLLEGGALYEAQAPGTGLPYTYPPISALLMVPIALLGVHTATFVWTFLSLFALAVVIALCVGDRPWLIAALTVAAVGLEPVLATLSFGQVNLLLLLLILYDVLRRRDSRWGGLLLGLAAGIKLTPLLLIGFMAFIGYRRFAATALGAFVGTVVIGFAVAPSSAWTYWTSAVTDPSRVGGVAYASNQSVNGELMRVLGVTPSLTTWFVVASAVALVAVLVGRWFAQRGDMLMALNMAALAMLLASPISWSHHWVWAVPLVIGLLRLGLRAWAIAAVAVFASYSIWWPPNTNDQELHWSLVEHLVGNAYLWLAIMLPVTVWRLSAAKPRDQADASPRERDASAQERDASTQERDASVQQRDASAQERDASVVE